MQLSGGTYINHLEYDEKWRIEWRVDRLPGFGGVDVFHKARCILKEHGKLVEVQEKIFKHRGSARQFNRRARARMQKYIHEYREKILTPRRA